MGLILDVIYLLAALAASPKILYRMLRQYRYRHGWSQRLGKIARHDPRKKCIWIHAVSLGEVNATRTLVGGLVKHLPDYEIVFSTSTDTGYARACGLYGKNHSVFYTPFDFSLTMRRAFKNIKPDLILLMELEVWPNLVRIAQKKNIPVLVVNGRISERSFPRYKLITPVTRWMFRKVTLFLVQTSEYAERFRTLGAPSARVVVTSSLKYDTAKVTDTLPGAEDLRKQLALTDTPLWVAGGTGPDEEKILLELFKMLRIEPGLGHLRLAVIPRKPERFDEVAALIGKFGLKFLRFSGIKGTKFIDEERHPVILGDTMGDLSRFYNLASVVFVGRSLVPMGGSDMIEPAALGKCITFGPYTFNFTQTVDELLRENGALLVRDPHELFQVTRKCLTNPDFAAAIAESGRKVIIRNQGATQKTLTAVVKILKNNQTATSNPNPKMSK